MSYPKVDIFQPLVNTQPLYEILALLQNQALMSPAERRFLPAKMRRDIRSAQKDLKFVLEKLNKISPSKLHTK